MNLSILISNPLINVAVIGWVSAQLLKTIGVLITQKTFDKSRLSGAGGMPSSHSAVTCGVLLTSYFLYGFDSPIFAMAFVFALIVMYDATGVRWAAGLHAKAINNLVNHLDDTVYSDFDESVEDDDTDDQTPEDYSIKNIIPKLNESLGHKKIEALCGAFLGFAIAIIAELLR